MIVEKSVQSTQLITGTKTSEWRAAKSLKGVEERKRISSYPPAIPMQRVWVMPFASRCDNAKRPDQSH